MSTYQSHKERPATLAEIRDLGPVPLWHSERPDAADILGISRHLAYAGARSGHIPTVRIGGRVLVPVPALRRLVGDLPPLPAVEVEAVAG